MRGCAECFAELISTTRRAVLHPFRNPFLHTAMKMCCIGVAVHRHTLPPSPRPSASPGLNVPLFDTNLICVNADQLPLFFESMRGQLRPGARNVGLWAWEVEDLPEAMARNERYLDEVWGISSFTAATLARNLSKPVRAFPLPV